MYIPAWVIGPLAACGAVYSARDTWRNLKAGSISRRSLRDSGPVVYYTRAGSPAGYWTSIGVGAATSLFMTIVALACVGLVFKISN